MNEHPIVQSGEMTNYEVIEYPADKDTIPIYYVLQTKLGQELYIMGGFDRKIADILVQEFGKDSIDKRAA